MSTEWLPTKPVPFSEIRGLKGRVHDQYVNPNPDQGVIGTTEKSCCLTDGKDYLWAFDNKGNTWFTCYSMNDEQEILRTLARKFHCGFISEHDIGFEEVASEYDHVTISPSDMATSYHRAG